MQIQRVAFVGSWVTSFGPMTLEQNGVKVWGRYTYEGRECTLHGEVQGPRLHFTNQEPDLRGEGWFEMLPDQQGFWGEWRPRGGARKYIWEGVVPGFTGWWQTTFGLMDLKEEKGQIQGTYAQSSQIQGYVEGSQLIFHYAEPLGEFRYRDPISPAAAEVRGKGRFTLAGDGLSFQGVWLQEGAAQWAPWEGRRLFPKELLLLLDMAQRPAPTSAPPLPTNRTSSFFSQN